MEKNTVETLSLFSCVHKKCSISWFISTFIYYNI